MFQQDQPKTLQEHGFYRVCTATPKVHLGNPKKNSEEIIRLSQLADRSDAIITLFPELSLTGHSRNHSRYYLNSSEHFPAIPWISVNSPVIL